MASTTSSDVDSFDLLAQEELATSEADQPAARAAGSGVRAGGRWRLRAALAAAASGLGALAVAAGLATRGGLGADPGLLAEELTMSSCGLQEDSKLMLLLSSLGVRGPEIRSSFDEMVSKLPKSGGQADFSKLNLLEIYDPCMLKASFWDKDNKYWAAKTAMNYQKAGIKNLTPDLVGPFDFAGPDGSQLDASWCYNEWTDSSATGGLKDMGFASHTPMSIMDYMMDPEDFKTLVSINVGRGSEEDARALLTKLRKKSMPSALKELIDKADVIASCGGNPDIIAFVYRAFPSVGRYLKRKLNDGEAVYLGRSASSMVAGANTAFSDEPTPEMFKNILLGDGQGLGLLPTCIVKPHFKTEQHEAYASALEKDSGLQVVRMPNYAAFVCQAGSCAIEGSPKQEDLEWKVSPGHYNQHLDYLFESL